MTCLLFRDCNILPKKELHGSLQVDRSSAVASELRSDIFRFAGALVASPAEFPEIGGAPTPKALSRCIVSYRHGH